MTLPLIICASLMTVIWALIAVITRGLPQSAVTVLDQLTFRQFTPYIEKTGNGFYYDVLNSLMPTEVFLFLFGIIFILYVVSILIIESRRPDASALWFIIIYAVLFRAVMLPTEPVHENDFYRYIWDGKTITKGINPFKFAPSDLFMYENGYTTDHYDDFYDVVIPAREFSPKDAGEVGALIVQREEEPVMYDRIGHWQIPTIYPPVAQFVFAGTVAVFPPTAFWMKFIFVLFDLGTVFIIIALLKALKLRPELCAVYAWSPLVMKEVPNSGHYDPIAVFFTVLAVFLAVRSKQALSAVTLSLAALSKFFSGFLLPFLARPVKFLPMALFTGVFIVLYIPFFLWGNTGLGVFEGLSQYSEKWAYNPSLYVLIYNAVDAFGPAMWTDTHLVPKAITGSIFLCCLGFWAYRPPKDDIDMVRKCFYTMGLLFLLNPVGDPWYYLWVLPFLCVFPRKPWILLSGLLMLSYLNFQSSNPVVEATWFGTKVLTWIIYVPFYLYLIIEFMYKKIRKAEA